MIIGICGKSGSGKTSLANELLSSLDNSVHLEIDKVGHSVLTIDEVMAELINVFGSDVLVEDKIDRKALGEAVFNSREKMSKLSDITWKYMMIEIDNYLNNNSDKNIILDWLLLPLSKYFGICDLKILLDIPYEIRKVRAIRRDNISIESFDNRENSSIDYNNDCFDLVLTDNDYEKVKRLVKLYE